MGGCGGLWGFGGIWEAVVVYGGLVVYGTVWWFMVVYGRFGGGLWDGPCDTLIFDPPLLDHLCGPYDGQGDSVNWPASYEF